MKFKVGDRVKHSRQPRSRVGIVWMAGYDKYRVCWSETGQVFWYYARDLVLAEDDNNKEEKVTRVILSNGTTTLPEATLVARHGMGVDVLFDGSPSSDEIYFSLDAWTATEIRALPTEPGVYEAAAYPIADRYVPYILENGVLRESITGTTPDAAEVAEIGPFTRLEPVPVTAKKVLDALIEEFGADPKNSYIAECAGRVAAEFGVTE